MKHRGYLAMLDKYKEEEPTATVDQLKKKINTFRSNFRRELKKVFRSEKSGAGAEDIYEPNLWYFDDLSFLKDQEIAAGGKSTMDSDDNEENSEIQGSKSDNILSFKRSTKQDKSGQQQQLFFQKAVDHLEKNNDECEIYGRGWASEYRKLTTGQQLYAKRHIDDILFQGRLGQLTENWPSRQPSTFRSSTPLSLVSAPTPSPPFSRGTPPTPTFSGATPPARKRQLVKAIHLIGDQNTYSQPQKVFVLEEPSNSYENNTPLHEYSNINDLLRDTDYQQ